ncbi:hypothetical protein A7L08_18170 [Acinetobacter baumannii]|nr:hypothetical protein A7L08_18170 [Acinetobacter baumannii]
MIGKRTMIMTPKGKENPNRKPSLSHVNTVNPNHQKTLHLHQVHYPFTKKNSNGLQKIANLKFPQFLTPPHQSYNHWLV